MICEILKLRKTNKWLAPKWIFKVNLVFLIIAAFASIALFSKGDLAKRIDGYFFSGIGIGANSGSAHSSGTRLIETALTFQAGTMNPWMGVGLGGFGNFFIDNIGQFPLREFWLATALESAFRRADKFQFLEVRYPEPMNVTCEAFASAGIPGLVLWLIFNIMIPYRLIRLSKNTMLDARMRELLRAMAYGYISLFIILHFNQNFMRPYYWLHIAMCCSVYLVARNIVFQNKSHCPTKSKYPQ